MNKGDNVKVLPPFDVAFPDVYEVTKVKTDKDSTCTINDIGEDGLCVDRDFAPVYLEKV